MTTLQTKVTEQSGSFTVDIGDHSIEVCCQGREADKKMAETIAAIPELVRCLEAYVKGYSVIEGYEIQDYAKALLRKLEG